MKAGNWLVALIWGALLIALIIVLLVNAEQRKQQQNHSFRVWGGKLTSLGVVDGGQQGVAITLHKRFTLKEQEFLREVGAYTGKMVSGASAYQLHFPGTVCEFLPGMLVYCDTANLSPQALDQAYAIAWLQGEKEVLQLTPQQLAEQGLQITFHTSKAKKTGMNIDGQMRINCTLQAHLKISAYKSPAQNASMKIEDAFFILSDRACEA